MRRLLLLPIVLAVAACSRKVTPAPVKDGSFMVYEISEVMPTVTHTSSVRLSFKQEGELYTVSFAVEGSADPAPPPIKVNSALVPEENVISAYDLGRLWLPPEGRSSGARTPCGVVAPQRKFKQWDVFPVEGVCGRAMGTRFYELNTGMLVGYQYSGAAEIVAYVKESG